MKSSALPVTVASRGARLCAVALFSALAAASIWAQAPAGGPPAQPSAPAVAAPAITPAGQPAMPQRGARPGAPAGRGGRGGGRGTPAKPRNPVPILPALPAPDDKSFYAATDVPHGKVEVVTYKTTAGTEKTMRVYLPPGYDTSGDKRYPVLYLNHGGGENDTHWTASGFAHHILDNLIAAGKARPMIIAMPNTGNVVSGTPPKPGVDDACTQEYLKAIIPYVDGHYRTRATREGRAVAGLSMGGFVTLNTGLTHLETFGELYVFSSGYWPEQVAAFEENTKALLADPNINDQFRMPIYFAAGESDTALYNSMKTLAVLQNAGVRSFWVMSSHGHEWLNWRRYLWQTAQIMFPEER
jgi:enterochelin esterase-like enzyme